MAAFEEARHPRSPDGKFRHLASDAVSVRSRRRGGDVVSEQRSVPAAADPKSILLGKILQGVGSERYKRLLEALAANRWLLNEDEAARVLGVNRVVLTMAWRPVMRQHGDHQPIRVGKPNNRGISSITVPSEWQPAVRKALGGRG